LFPNFSPFEQEISTKQNAEQKYWIRKFGSPMSN